ncbi:hypothetical protein E2C01_092971 [Portunus trituberculatus]|uniref:Uncharacterized protein n=1 Tax=Portunus trituberculatus TaxID=210409 RepID=A0A5B7JWX8_PORTR|nr:hypothetical protein [Portunus trituberculatus]
MQELNPFSTRTRCHIYSVGSGGFIHLQKFTFGVEIVKTQVIKHLGPYPRNCLRPMASSLANQSGDRRA